MTLPPALLYHKVCYEWEAGVTFVQPHRFARQMELLKQQGWETVLPNGGLPPSTGAKKRFLLSFDDGYESVFHNALPILSEVGYQGMVFIPTGCIGRYNDWDNQLLGRRFRHLDRGMIRELVANGWLIGSHGITHSDMTALNPETLRRELTESRIELQDLTGNPIEWLAFPFGRYNRDVVAAAYEAGYKGGVTPALHRNGIAPDFILWRADAVYLWDPSRLVAGRPNRSGIAYRSGRLFRRATNLCANGTLLYDRWVRRRKIAN